MQRLRVLVLLTLLCLSACGWIHSRRSHAPDPTQIVVTGAPAGALVFIDGVQAGEATVANNYPQTLDVTAGAHTVEIRAGNALVYREDTYVGAGEHRVINVLSGFKR
ncbi:MAG: hypothetical protein ABSF94_14875 [Steroidobacteraceae bacterium]